MAGFPIRFGIQTGQQFAAWDEIVRIWQRAEALGYDTAWTYDHFVAVMMDPFDPTLEAWSCLAALAVQTTRIRIGALVTGNTYRHPAILAKIATTVDVISKGRLEFGIGAGWYEPEHAMFGLRFGSVRERCERLDEALTVIRALWREQQATFSGKHHQLSAAIAEPKPVQRPHPPITIAGAGEKRLLPIVARHADGWSSFGSPEVFQHKIEILRALCDAEQRDGDAIEKGVLVPAAITEDLSTAAPLIQGYAMYQGLSEDEARRWMLLGGADDVCRQLDAFIAAGVTHFVLTLSPYNFDVFERFAAEVMPRYR
ncbi:MAG TPA: LLM class F420-dependent oxidoreductase [Candidatus Kryptonia bacterium]|nr:LLM class F420-dependent oxidoreductase [Candidatus Kryptonia bacterium]